MPQSRFAFYENNKESIQHIMRHTIVVDAGNGQTYAIKINPKHDAHVSIPSLRARVTGARLDYDGVQQMEFDYADYNGQRWVYGEDVLSVSRDAIDSHRGAFRYGDEFHKFMVSVACAELNVTTGIVDLILFVPPGLYNAKAPEVKGNFIGKNTIQLKDDLEPREWEWGSVSVKPEGLAGIACFMLDKDGNFNKGAELEDRMVIVDIGMHTLDSVVSQKGILNPESLPTATIEHGGIMDHILKPALAYIRKEVKSEDFSVLTVYDLNEVLRSGLTEDDWTLRFAGHSYNTKEVFEWFGKQHAQWIKNNLFDNMYNGLLGYSRTVVFGGGEALTHKELADIYGGKFRSVRQVNVNPLEANAQGAVRAEKAKRKQAAKNG